MSAEWQARLNQNPAMKLGIIAGGGSLPSQLVDHCQKHNIEYVVVGLEGFAEIESDFYSRIGLANKIFLFLDIKKVTDVVLIGSVERPTIQNLWPDWETFIFFLKAWLKSFGDSRLLDAARLEIEKRGFTVRGVHEFLPELLMPEGAITKIMPAPKFDDEIELGFIAAKKHGEADKGQSVIILNGNVIAREGKSGTSAMIREHGRKGAILVKACKPQQDRNLDLPTIGPETAQLCANRKMRGIIAEAGATLLVDRAKTAQIADQHQMFIMGIKNEPI
ncbi:MAG: UDP-2,3-diacylglucosamine diphosphatase LpxI [Pseudomonadota bacterium]